MSLREQIEAASAKAAEAHTAALIEGAGELCERLEWYAYNVANGTAAEDIAQAAATIAALTAELARVKEEGVRLGIEAAARVFPRSYRNDDEWSAGFDSAVMLGLDRIRALDPAAITRRETALSELAEHDAVLIDGEPQ